ncbi:DUF4190 domain-containing protein [Cellulomonas sp. H30R-01]|uniref:DUF4190 domain-containing protein n=1 Tax=Cellulomonas sp. H30R-01 TaxID=2704467 RepID=UPI00138B8159|nr:DUF4190 domain-containing protein [Cellulomonas sp. H30R-01]QHT56819.1 DUF4190 domain-containing protein [Cellulomonas sp. H30R-01]
MTAPLPPGPVAPGWSLPPVPRTSGLAVASLVLALCGFGLLPVVLGHLALRRIRQTGERGSGLAVAGLVLGYTTLALVVVVLLVVAGSVWWGVQA